MRCFAPLALAVLTATSAHGHACSHPLVGRVLDQDAKPIRGAIIEVADTGAFRGTDTSDSTGHYQVCAVPLGTVRLTARALGRNPTIWSAIPIRGGHDSLDVTMGVRPACRAVPRLSATQLDAAEQLWKQNGLHSYSFQVTASSSWVLGEAWTVTVRNDTMVASAKVGAVTRTKPDLVFEAFMHYLPNHLFARLRGRLTDSSVTTIATYDPILGYPTFVRESPNCISDADLRIRIDSLRPITP
jgi:hypothetical protein